MKTQRKTNYEVTIIKQLRETRTVTRRIEKQRYVWEIFQRWPPVVLQQLHIITIEFPCMAKEVPKEVGLHFLNQRPSLNIPD